MTKTPEESTITRKGTI